MFHLKSCLVLAVFLLALCFPPSESFATPAILNWQNNATNATGVRIERALFNPTTLNFNNVGSVAPTIVIFNDAPPDNQIYCYRVLAFLTVGTVTVDSNPSNVACQKPSSPSVLTIQ